MIALMIAVFLIGYACIALEHPLKVNKAAPALIIGVLTWVLYITMGNLPAEETLEHLQHHLGETSETLFFLLAAMTIVEVVDSHSGFSVLTNIIKTRSKVRLLWIICILTFFMSAVLDNLTTTIVMIALLRKLIADKETRWTFVGAVIIAANAGGAWSPIGDVTTIMLWIGGQISALNIIGAIFIPSLVALVVPLAVLSFTMKGEVQRPSKSATETNLTSRNMQIGMLCLGVLMLVCVPPFKMITHLPPYMGMLLGLGIVWVVTEIMHRKRDRIDRERLIIETVMRKVDVPTILFFLGILTAVGALATAGILKDFSGWLDEVTDKNIYVINLTIGVLSSVVDNVPLVAGAMGMYEIAADAASVYAIDGTFWEMLAYCAGTGGSILIIGSAAGVAAMGLEKIDFMWYIRRMSWLALLGYLAGALVFFLMK
ncbi:MAG: sodium:proton antiporter NhaD [Bacteroidales bacterium]|nr:sodium:proton antiporter NhaD [Bacteroidales bacterium]